jgi:hypothetical protein
MPCIFCIAVFMLISGALAAAHMDDIEEKLKTKAEDKKVERTVDTESVTKFELSVKVKGKSVPVAVTVYKDHKRVRIQILTHELGREAIEALEDELAEALEAKVVDRSDPESEATARHAHGHDAEADAEAAKERPQPARSQPERVAPKESPRRGGS